MGKHNLPFASSLFTCLCDFKYFMCVPHAGGYVSLYWKVLCAGPAARETCCWQKHPAVGVRQVRAEAGVSDIPGTECTLTKILTQPFTFHCYPVAEMLHHFSNFKFSCLRAHPWPLHVAPLLFCALFPWRDRQYVFHKSLTLQNAIDSFIQIHATIFLSKITFCKMSQT